MASGRVPLFIVHHPLFIFSLSVGRAPGVRPHQTRLLTVETVPARVADSAYPGCLRALIVAHHRLVRPALAGYCSLNPAVPFAHTTDWVAADIHPVAHRPVNNRRADGCPANNYPDSAQSDFPVGWLEPEQVLFHNCYPGQQAYYPRNYPDSDYS